MPWNEALEETNSIWMADSKIFRPEMLHGSLGGNPADDFLLELIDRPTDSLAAKFVTVMKKKVMEDRGCEDTINRY